MAGHGCILVESLNAWQVLAIDSRDRHIPPRLDIDVSPDELAQWAWDVISRQRLDGRQLLLAPDARSTFFATFPTQDLGSARDRSSHLYRLEDSLPFDAEDIVADFQVGRSVVSSVCIERKRWIPIVEALERKGLLVQSVVPAALLACQSLIREPGVRAADLILCQNGDDCHLFRIRDEQLIQWRCLPHRSESLLRELSVELLDLEDPARVVAIHVDSDLGAALRARASTEVQHVQTETWESHVARSAGEVLRCRQQPWCELRRGPLTNGDPARPYRRALGWLYAAIALFLISLSASCWWRAQRDDRLVSEVLATQTRVFQRAFPVTRPPAALLARLRSEHAKVTGSRRTGEDVPLPHSALDVLYGLLSALPTDTRFHLTEIRIANGELNVDVELNSHSDAGVLATALETHGFAVVPPTTNQAKNRTVQSRLQAIRHLPVRSAEGASGPRGVQDTSPSNPHAGEPSA